MAKKNSGKKFITETIDSYIARGGAVKRLDSPAQDKQLDAVKTTNQGGPAIFLSLEEADLFFGEVKKTKPKKAKPSLTIDLSVLPPALRAKFISKLKEDNDGESYEEELEEASEED